MRSFVEGLQWCHARIAIAAMQLTVHQHWLQRWWAGWILPAGIQCCVAGTLHRWTKREEFALLCTQNVKGAATYSEYFAFSRPRGQLHCSKMMHSPDHAHHRSNLPESVAWLFPLRGQLQHPDHLQQQTCPSDHCICVEIKLHLPNEITSVFRAGGTSFATIVTAVIEEEWFKGFH